MKVLVLATSLLSLLSTPAMAGSVHTLWVCKRVNDVLNSASFTYNYDLNTMERSFCGEWFKTGLSFCSNEEGVEFSNDLVSRGIYGFSTNGSEFRFVSDTEILTVATPEAFNKYQCYKKEVVKSWSE